MLSPQMDYPFDGIEHEEVVIATYFMEVSAGEDVLMRLRELSALFYPGTWTEVMGISPEKQKRHTASILGVYETPPYELEVPPDIPTRHFIVQIAIPLQDVGDSLTALLTQAAGEIVAYGGIKLLDLYLPRAYTAAFKGPKFGLQGIRDLLGVHDRPLLLAIFKPSRGYSPQEGAAIFYEAAVGGADIVKDDELLTDPSYCRRVERVRLYAQAAQRAFEETGERTLYAVNITDRPDRLLPNALEALELGANALMISYLQVGLDATRLVCEDAGITLPILGHNSGATSFYAGTHAGMSAVLANAKLPRLAGVDMAIVLSGQGSYPMLRERCLLVARELRGPFHHLRATLPIIASGIVPGCVDKLCADFGWDVALASGSSLFGHPAGARAGARAFRQAIGAVMAGRDLADAAAEHEELRTALQLWGAA